MSVKERLVDYLKFKKVSKVAFGKAIGVSASYINSMRQSIQPDKILSIAQNFPDLNTEWLMTGEGEMLKRPKNNFTQLTEEQMGDMITEAVSDMLLDMYKKGEIYSEDVHKKAIAQKDEQIAELQKRIWELELKLK